MGSRFDVDTLSVCYPSRELCVSVRNANLYKVLRVGQAVWISSLLPQLSPLIPELRINLWSP